MYTYRLLSSAAVFRVLYWLVPKVRAPPATRHALQHHQRVRAQNAGIWGRVVPLTHLPAYADLQGAEIGARPRLHPKAPQKPAPVARSRARAA
jgi:hypothetical protein